MCHFVLRHLSLERMFYKRLHYMRMTRMRLREMTTIVWFIVTARFVVRLRFCASFVEPPGLHGLLHDD